MIGTFQVYSYINSQCINSGESISLLIPPYEPEDHPLSHASLTSIDIDWPDFIVKVNELIKAFQ